MITKKQIEKLEEEIKRLNRVDDRLEQRLAKLEKVLESHAKTIGEIREEKQCPTKKQ